MTIDVYLHLSDIGLFKKRKPHERLSQYERAVEIRDQFATCMRLALRHNHCVMPQLCAYGAPGSYLSCEHLSVDYTNFSGRGIRLTGKARTIIDARLRAIGTLVHRKQTWFAGELPGDIYVPALERISSFTGQRKAAGVSSRRAAARVNRGFFSRLFD